MSQKFSPFDKDVDKLTTSDLALLKQVREGWHVDYKAAAIGTRELAKALSAFANTYGGWLFLGIEQASSEEPVAGAFVGIAREDVDPLLQRIRQASSAHLSPGPHFNTKTLWGPADEIGLPTDRAVICIEVPMSFEAPHVHSDGRIFRRVSDSSDPAPENDRRILDKLWDRRKEIIAAVERWIERKPEFRGEETQRPYIRLLMDVDPWGERRPWLDLSLAQIRSVLADEQEGITSVPFDAVHTAGRGFIARQRAGNDPSQLNLQWRISRDLSGEVIIPLPFFEGYETHQIEDLLEGYENAARFEAILVEQEATAPSIADFNFLFGVLCGVCATQRRLLRMAGAEPVWKFKAQFLNAARMIPFVDAPYILDEYERHGVPVCFDNCFVTPTGSDPNSFAEVSPTPPDIDERNASLLQANFLFLMISYACGLPVETEDRDKPEDDQSLLEQINQINAGGRRAQEAQRLRRKRFGHR